MAKNAVTLQKAVGGKVQPRVAAPSEMSSQVDMDDFQQMPTGEEMALPTVRLAQGLTQEVSNGDAKPGEWILPDGETSDEITVLIVGMRRNRMLRNETEILCRSLNGFVGEGSPGGDCDMCPMAEWSEGPNDSRVPPKCTLMFQYLVQLEEDMMSLATLTMSTRSASKVIAQINTHIKMHGFNRVVLTLSTKLVNKGNKRYYVPQIGKMALAAVEEPEEFEYDQPSLLEAGDDEPEEVVDTDTSE